MKRSYFLIFIDLLRDVLFLPYYFTPNLLVSLYTFRKVKGLKKIASYVFLPLLNLLFPLYQISVKLILKLHDDDPDERNSEFLKKSDEVLITEIIEERLKKPIKPLKKDFQLSDLKIETLEKFKTSTGYIHSVSFIVPAVLTALVLYRKGVLESNIGIFSTVAAVWIGCLTVIGFLYEIIYPESHKEYCWNDLINSRDDLSSTRDGLSRYELALENYRNKARLVDKAIMRQSWEYWFSKDGQEFEEAVAMLCSDKGYKVTTTPKTGDKGVDLFMEKGDETYVVQCKSYNKTIGPKVVRELYGTLMDIGADKAVLAAPRGFTSGVYQFAKGKPIELWDVNVLTKMTYDFESYTDYELANARSVDDIIKHVRSISRR